MGASKAPGVNSPCGFESHLRHTATNAEHGVPRFGFFAYAYHLRDITVGALCPACPVASAPLPGPA